MDSEKKKKYFIKVEFVDGSSYRFKKFNLILELSYEELKYETIAQKIREEIKKTEIEDYEFSAILDMTVL